MPGSLRAFLSLYDHATRQSVAWAVTMTSLIAIFDFLSLVLLYPVFGTLASGGGKATTVSIGPSGLGRADPNILLAAAMLLMIGRSSFGFAARVWWSRRAARAEIYLSSRVLSSYAYAPYEFHLRSNSSELLARSVTHVNLATSTALSGLVNLAADATATAAMTAALFVVSPIAAVVIALFLMVVGGLISWFSKYFVRRKTQLLTREVGRVFGRAANVLRGIRELTVANARDPALGSVTFARTEMVSAQRVVILLGEVPKIILEVALYSAILASLFWVLQGDDPSRALPLVALYVVAGLRVLPTVARVLGGQTAIRSGMEIGRNIRHQLNEIETFRARVMRPSENLPETGALTVEGVSFSYAGQEMVLRDISLNIPFGQIVGLVGSSGAGKTTLLSIMLGLLSADSGQVKFGGADVGLADSTWLARVAYVPQDVYVADDTLLANVALGDHRPDIDRVHQALKQARLEEVVRGMPNGLNTRLHEGGSRLSVGQRQRLGIARALYRNARVLFLDEPTAALDQGTESEVLDTLLALRGSVTMVVVAHRLRTLSLADRVFRIGDGLMSEELGYREERVHEGTRQRG
jgi:ATP-binding cassette, subfamily B, bacterial PglK